MNMSLDLLELDGAIVAEAGKTKCDLPKVEGVVENYALRCGFCERKLKLKLEAEAQFEQALQVAHEDGQAAKLMGRAAETCGFLFGTALWHAWMHGYHSAGDAPATAPMAILHGITDGEAWLQSSGGLLQSPSVDALRIYLAQNHFSGDWRVEPIRFIQPRPQPAETETETRTNGELAAVKAKEGGDS